MTNDELVKRLRDLAEHLPRPYEEDRRYSQREQDALLANIEAVEAAADALALRPEEGASWKHVNDVTPRQVAWIDVDARYVAVVRKGQEFMLELPPLPQKEQP